MTPYKDYLEIVSENFDLSDSYTMEKVILCNEAEKESVLVHLTGKLYNHIKNKVDEIDFGTIPNSKGDITKIDNFTNLVDCVSTISSLIREYNQSTEQIDVISTAIENIKSRTPMWTKAFALNTEMPKITYNTMTLSVVSAVSLLITTCIEYIKNGDGTIKTAFDKAAYIKTKDHVLFTSLREFNFACSKGDVDKFLTGCIKNNLTAVKEAYDSGDMEALDEVGSESIGIILAALLALVNIKFIIRFIVHCLRNAVYYFMFMRQSVADYFAIQADYLQINAENLKYRDMDDSTREKVKNRQMKWVDRFRRWSNAWMIKDKKAQNQTKKQQEEDNKRGKYEDEDGNNDGDGGIF